MAIAQKTLKPSRYCAIERFLKVLELIDLNGQIERLDSSIIHKISDASFLYREGLIAGVEVPAISGYSIENATLTPKGAVAMYEWGNIIESHSIASKAKMAFAIAGTFAFTIVTEVGVLLIARSLGLGQ